MDLRRSVKLSIRIEQSSRERRGGRSLSFTVDTPAPAILSHHKSISSFSPHRRGQRCCLLPFRLPYKSPSPSLRRPFSSFLLPPPSLANNGHHYHHHHHITTTSLVRPGKNPEFILSLISTCIGSRTCTRSLVVAFSFSCCPSPHHRGFIWQYDSGGFHSVALALSRSLRRQVRQTKMKLACPAKSLPFLLRKGR